MDEQATFEARAVLAPRRSRLARLAVLLTAVALLGIVWGGFSGGRPALDAASSPDPSSVAQGVPQLKPPAQVVGLDVHPLDDVQSRGLGRDEVVAVAGWYVATAITHCPPLAALYREGALPEVRGDADGWAFCDRSGVLYASPPNHEDNQLANAEVPGIAVTLVVGVVVPPELELVGEEATEVVVVGRFVEPGGGCSLAGGCRRELVVDHVAWTPGA